MSCYPFAYYDDFWLLLSLMFRGDAVSMWQIVHILTRAIESHPTNVTSETWFG